MNIIIYDDHPFVTEAIAAYIKTQSENLQVTQCHKIADAKNVIECQVPDIIISDVLSEEDGFSLFSYIFKSHPDIQVIIYTSLTNDFIIQSLLDMGVIAVVNKKEKISTLWDKVENIYSNRKQTKQQRVIMPLLTPREREIAIFLSQGLLAKIIADKLGTSVNTINNQKNALLKKFNCANSTELVVKLSKLGMLGEC